MLQLLIALGNASIKYRTAVLLDLATGLRRGEILELEWSYIDFNKKIIEIINPVNILLEREQSLKSLKLRLLTELSLFQSVLQISLPTIRNGRQKSEQKQEKNGLRTTEVKVLKVIFIEHLIIKTT